MKTVIRKATLEDALDIAKVHVDCWKTTYKSVVPQEYIDSLSYKSKANKWTEIIASGSNIFIALVDENIVGFIDTGMGFDDGRDTDLFAFYVLEQFQRKEIGSKLFQQARIFYKDNGYKDFRLWVLKENPYVPFYTKNGGQPKESKTINIAGKKLEEIMYWFEV